MAKLDNWQICCLGVEYSDYFQGFGCSLTPYKSCAVGIGCSEQEAAEDALEQIAYYADEIPEELEKEVKALSAIDEIEACLKDYDVDPETMDETPWVHVGIRYNLEQVKGKSNV